MERIEDIRDSMGAPDRVESMLVYRFELPIPPVGQPLINLATAGTSVLRYTALTS